MRETAGSAAAPAARCRKVLRASFTVLPPQSTLRRVRAIQPGRAVRIDYAPFMRTRKGQWRVPARIDQPTDCETAIYEYAPQAIWPFGSSDNREQPAPAHRPRPTPDVPIGLAVANRQKN